MALWLAALVAIPATGEAASAQPGAVVDRPVAFSVVNKNDSRVPCQSDGGSYTARGSIVGPAVALARPNPAVTLYIHGNMVAGDNLWRMRPAGDASFDYGLTMAQLGHVSVSVELVGYGSSVLADRPDGNLVCQGSHADVINQVLQRLRSGDYAFGNAPKGPAFSRVALAGLSYGVQVSQPAAYSFGGIDALIVMGYAEPPLPTPEAALLVGEAVTPCATGGQPKHGTYGPPGYFLFSPDRAPAAMFNDPDPRAEAEWTRLVERDPCGAASSAGARVTADAQHLGEITVPVLLAFGDHDEAFGQPGPQLHLQRFSGSTDRTVMLFPGAGHVFFLERKRAQWIALTADWLAQREL